MMAAFCQGKGDFSGGGYWILKIWALAVPCLAISAVVELLLLLSNCNCLLGMRQTICLYLLF